ncbi:MAG: FdtA/QdtA family cupin domain-containing protein [Sulfurospirillaceae bacterium]|nr:FdtA/QdtA family cupin domain-containing protein [Sulfurospirillaceae bacterium]
MAHMIDLPTFSDQRGNLTVVEKVIPFEIKRVYYIYGATEKRGGHRHKKNQQALICLGGSCEIYVHNGTYEETFLLHHPNQCLILDARDWHTMDNFSHNSTLLIFASEYYDLNDYIDEEY